MNSKKLMEMMHIVLQLPTCLYVNSYSTSFVSNRYKPMSTCVMIIALRGRPNYSISQLRAWTKLSYLLSHIWGL